jgi:NADH dehydrogenase
VAAPIRGIVGGYRNITVMLGDVSGVDVAARTVSIARGRRVAYDYLILVTGARHAYFGHDDWEPFAPALKRIEDATEIRRRILIAFERAENEPDPVILVEAGPRLLPSMPEDLSEEALQRL